MTSFAWPGLPSGPTGVTELSETTRADLQRYLQGLLHWHQSLSAWPPAPRNAPSAMPIVSLYVDGCTRGCFGSVEGVAEERIARAFLKALHDGRFAQIRPSERAKLSVCLSYLEEPLRLDFRDIEAKLEPATHGLAVVPRAGSAALLHPSVALDHRLDARGMLQALAHKAGRLEPSSKAPQWRDDDTFYLFKTCDIVVHGEEPVAASGSVAALRFLESLIHADGRVSFACDSRSGRHVESGPMFHGRVAVALAALALHHPASAKLALARERLHRDVAQGLAGDPVPGWPSSGEQVAGTLALCVLAGVAIEPQLAELAVATSFSGPWHCAQVVTALGEASPPQLLAAVLAADDAWSPWVLRACRAARCHEQVEARANSLLKHIRNDAPYLGGVGAGVAELARTAATIEGLQGLTGPAIERGVSNARAFLQRWQLRRTRCAWLAKSADGAFPIAPNQTLTQVDTLGHALCALHAGCRDGP